jgi:hypothetical protein
VDDVARLLTSVPDPVPSVGHFKRALLGRFSRAPKQVIENSVGLNIALSVLIKNFGVATAFNVKSNIAFSIPFTTKDSITRPNFPPACASIDPKTPGVLFGGGNVVFSGEGFVQGFETAFGTTMKPDTMNEISRIWVIGCIAYSDESSRMHYTKFWLRSTHADDAPWIDIVPTFGKAKCRYKPVVGFESWGEEAN